ATTLTVAVADFVGSSLLVAVTVTVVLWPTGATKMPLTSTVPADAVQVTPNFPFVTFAVNETVWPVPVAVVCGLTLTLTGAVTVNVEEAPGVPGPAAVAGVGGVAAPTLAARAPAPRGA